MAAVTTAFPLVGNLLGLPNGWARGLGSVGTAQTSYLDDSCSGIWFGTGNMVNPVGNILLFIVTAEEANRFTDGVDPNSAATQHTLIGQATQANLVQRFGGPSFPLAPNTRYSFNSFSIKSILGGTPVFWSPLIWNLSGDMLSVIIPSYAVHTSQT